MALTTSTITGRVPLPDDANPAAAEIVFTLSGYDTEGSQVIPGGAKARFVLDDGDMPAGAKLWRNTEGLRGTVYAVEVAWSEAGRRETLRRTASLGVVQVGDDASYTLGELLDATPVPVPDNTYWRSITQQDYDDMMAAKADAEAAAAERFPSRAATEAWAADNTPVDGRTYTFKGQIIRGLTGSTVLPDLPGFAPAGVIANADLLGVVTGTVSEGQALINAQRINAWLAAAPGNGFDFRSDEIGVAEAIRLGSAGCFILATSGVRVFGSPTSGGRMKWQGADGGTMIDMRNLSTTADLDSPSVIGLSLDGNGKAGIGVKVRGCQRPLLRNVFVRGIRGSAGDRAFDLGENPDATGGQVNCCYHGLFDNIGCVVDAETIGIYCGGSTGSGQNTTFCTFINVHITHEDGHGLYMIDADDNAFVNLGFSRVVGGTGQQIYLDGASGDNQYVVGNTFYQLHCGVQDGTAGITSTGSKARQNRIYGLSGVDTAAAITVSAGSRLFYDFLGTGYTATDAAEQALTVSPAIRLANRESTDATTLDWVQEADFTPLILINSSQSGITQSGNAKAYRIGRQVTVTGEISVTNKGSFSAGDVVTLYLANLPDDMEPTTGSIVTGGLVSNAGYSSGPIVAYVSASTNVSLYKGYRSAGTFLTYADITPTWTISFQFVFHRSIS